MDFQALFTDPNGVFSKKHILVTGHYGTGKTNLALNLALRLSERGPVCLIDCDIVNPYFRSSDCRKEMEEKGIRVIAPNFAGTNLDAPSLPPEIYGVFGRKEQVVWDIGGDDAGAIALGRFASRIEEEGYSMLYVINKFRPLTETADEMAEYMRDIETNSRLKTTAVINNSNLSYQTEEQTVKEGEACAEELVEKVSLPLLFTCVEKNISLPDKDRYFPVEILTRMPW